MRVTMLLPLIFLGLAGCVAVHERHDPAPATAVVAPAPTATYVTPAPTTTTVVRTP